MSEFLLGLVSMGCAVASLCFFRYWRDTHERLFLYFGLSFLIEALNRAHFALSLPSTDDEPLYYGVRLLSYLLILWAILEKNLPRRGAP